MPRKSGDTPSYRVTSAGVNPAEDRAHRMRMYFIAMTLRLACVLSLFWVTGWWIIVPVVGAIALPWFAVMVGNAVAYGGEQEVAAPDPLELAGAEPASGTQAAPGESADDVAATLLVVDVDPVRRSQRNPASRADSVAPDRSGDGSPAAPGPTTHHDAGDEQP